MRSLFGGSRGALLAFPPRSTGLAHLWIRYLDGSHNGYPLQALELWD